MLKIRVLFFGLIRLLPAASILAMAGCTSRHQDAVGSCGAGIIAGEKLSSHSDEGSSTVFIYSKFTDGKHYACSGTLIGRRLVLTAQHCIDQAVSSQIIFADDLNSEAQAATATRIRIDHIEKYAATVTHPHDLAVLHLVSVAPEAYSVRALPPAAFDVTHAFRLEAAGYGITSECADDDGTLRLAKYDMSDLRSSYAINADGDSIDYDQPGMLMLDQSRTGICSGDSGGPLFAETDGQLQLIGVTSFTVNTHGFAQSKILGCHGLALFTDVRLNLDWINAAAAKLSAAECTDELCGAGGDH